MAAAAAAVVGTVCSWGTLGPVAGALVAGTVSAAVVTTNETVFAIADLAGGYKSWEEVGKSLMMIVLGLQGKILCLKNMTKNIKG